MSLTLVYDDTLSRVRASATGLVDTTTFRLERSTDQIRWSTVRGAQALTPAGGTTAVDDYEFAPDVPNWYRLRGPAAFDDFDRTVASGLGTATSGQAYTLNGPSGFSVSDGRAHHSTSAVNSTFYGTVDVGAADQLIHVQETLPVVPTGAGITLRAFGRFTDTSNYYQAMLIFSVGGNVQIQLLRNVLGSPASLTSATLIGTHSAGNTWNLVLSVVGNRISAKAWKTTQTEPQDWQVEATDTALTSGNRAGFGGRRETGNTNGAITIDFDNFIVSTPETTIFGPTAITPTLDAVWLKSIGQPFLNRRVTVTQVADITRPARIGIFEVINRSYPVAVTDVRGSRRYALTLFTPDEDTGNTLDLLLSSGDPVLLHVPAGRNIPGGYFVIGDTTEVRFGGSTPQNDPRTTTLPFTAVAPPTADVVPATTTWQAIINGFATWNDVLAEFATWADVSEYIANPEDVIVP